MDKEKIDSSISLMDDILDEIDKGVKVPEHTEEDYKSLENKYNEEISKYEKLENDYQNLFQKYKDRFTDSVASSRNYQPVEEREEPKEAEVLDIRSIF